MSSPLVLVAGDRAPTLDVTIRRRGVPVDLTGHTATARIKPADRPPFERTLTVVTPQSTAANKGRALLAWQAGDLALPDGVASEHWEAEFVLDDDDPTQETTPAPLRFTVRAELA
jgi:hypothetical protein